MRKFVLHLILFIALVALADFLLGMGCLYMRKHAQNGTFQHMEYAAKTCEDSILIFGSSRALHHYSPKVISDSLGFSCHNFGHEGMGVLYTYGLLQLTVSHHVPKIIIYDYCRFDNKKDDPLTYLTYLRPYCDYPCIKDYFQELAPVEYVKDLSLTYRFNSKLLQLIYGIANKTKMTNGFQPLKGHIKNSTPTIYGSEVDSIKYEYMTKMIEICQAKGIQLIFFISPYFNGNNPTFPEAYKDLFDHYGIRYFDNQDADGFKLNKEYFRDRTHLNKEGAVAYTQYIIHQIREAVE